MGRDQTISINRSLKEVDSNLHGWLWRLKTSAEEVTANVLEIARELELKVKPGIVTKFQLSHDKSLMDEDLLLMVNKEKWLLEKESTPGRFDECWNDS